VDENGRARRRSIARSLAAVLGIAALALGGARALSPYKPWRQMGIFAPADRIRNFRAMNEIFPVRSIPRSTHPHVFDSRPVALPSTFLYQAQERKLDELLERTVTTGFLVLKENAVLSERYFRGATADAPLTSWSVAKSVVSLLVGIAHDEGLMPDLDAPLARYAPELEGSDYGRVPVRAALDMSSGIDFREDYRDPLSDIHTMFARLFLMGGHGESVGHYLASRRRDAEPGTRFRYESSDTLAVGLALRHATGMPLAEYLERKLWQPLGMEYAATWNVEDGEGVELAFCCLNVRLRDYAKIGRLAARGGDWDGQRIVSASWLEESTRVDPKRAPGTIPGMSVGYTHFWWLSPGNRGTFMARGVWGQFIYVNPTKQVVIVKTSVDPDFMQNAEETHAAFGAIDAAL